MDVFFKVPSITVLIYGFTLVVSAEGVQRYPNVALFMVYVSKQDDGI